MTKKIIAALLLVVMMIPMVVACGTDDPVVDDPAANGSEAGGEGDVSDSESESDQYNINDDLGDIDLGGRTITIARVDRSWYADEVKVDGLNGNVINDAVFKRNQALQKDINITLAEKKYGTGATDDQYAVARNLRGNMESGTHAYDLIDSPAYCTIMYANEGILTDLKQLEAINFNKLYWAQHFNEAMSMGDSQYMVTGATNLSFYRFTFVTFVNDTFLDENTTGGAPDLFKVVEDGKWTIEYQKTLATQYYLDKGTTGMDETDIVGLVTCDYLSVDPYWSSCEVPILKKTDDNWFKYEMDKTRLQGVVEQVQALLSPTNRAAFCYDYTLYQSHETGNGEQIEVAKKFAKGEAAMATLRLVEVEDPTTILNMSDKYSILPVPKYTEDQPTYYSFVHDSFSAYAIPATAQKADLETYGQVLEKLASEGNRTVKQAYFETALKGQYSGDNAKSWDMLNMITNNVKIDAGVLLTKALNNVHQSLRTIIYWNNRGQTHSVTSQWTADRDATINQLLSNWQAQVKAVQARN